jgi:plastocyanin
MRKVYLLGVGLALVAGFSIIENRQATAQENSADPRIALADQCDPATFPSGLCVATPHRADVTLAEFGALLFSPLIATVVGHPAWRFEPAYVDLRAGHKLRVTNTGGENHTFTEVAAFGGGFVPPLNGVGAAGKVPLTPAPACVPPPGTVIVGPGTTAEIKGLSPGVHSFQCCIHPWMRAVVTVE